MSMTSGALQHCVRRFGICGNLRWKVTFLGIFLLAAAGIILWSILRQDDQGKPTTDSTLSLQIGQNPSDDPSISLPRTDVQGDSQSLAPEDQLEASSSDQITPIDSEALPDQLALQRRLVALAKSGDPADGRQLLAIASGNGKTAERLMAVALIQTASVPDEQKSAALRSIIIDAETDMSLRERAADVLASLTSEQAAEALCDLLLTCFADEPADEQLQSIGNRLVEAHVPIRNDRMLSTVRQLLSVGDREEGYLRQDTGMRATSTGRFKQTYPSDRNECLRKFAGSRVV